MPRKARVLVANCPHHIVQRGHNRKAVFLVDEDYRYYLGNLKEWKERLGIKFYENKCVPFFYNPSPSNPLPVIVR